MTRVYMREAGKNNDYLVRWGLKKMRTGWSFDQTVQAMNKMHKKSLKEIKVAIDNHISGDLLSIDINRCLHYLGEITGEITNEDRLDYIFSKFCIGK